MNVSIRVGAGLELGTGMARLSVTLTEDATVADLLEYLRAQYPDASRLESVVLVSNGEHISPSAPLSAGQEVALLLPISGG
jgi:molybdopterin converting factor small subunit